MKSRKRVHLKKLRGGPIIEVDPQIVRWRKKRRAALKATKPADTTPITNLFSVDE